MKDRSIILVAALMLIAAVQSCPAASRKGGADSGQALAESGIWRAQIDGGQIEFELRQSDFGEDFVIYMDADRQKRSWQLIRWTMAGGKIVLISTSGRPSELSEDWTLRSVRMATFPAHESSRGTYLVDVTSLFQRPFPAGWGREDGPDRGSFLAPKAFQNNLVVGMQDPSDGQGKGALARWNFIRLPAGRMQARRLYGRTAFMHPGFLWGKATEIPDEEYEVVQRWRLDGARDVDGMALPRTPIIVHIDPSTPERWRPFVRKGIESWQAAFDAIGFKAAIQVREVAQGESWDPDDLRYSMLCWTRDSERCRSNVVDPRTGEILQSQISSTDTALDNFLARYVVGMAAVDPRVLAEKFPDEFLGGLYEWVAAHEMGHFLGLKDGGFGTFSYTPDQVRDSNWVERNGFSPSVMNYARFNYVAQPEDHMPGDLLLQKVGPADLFWIRWGYSDKHSEEDLTGIWNSSGLYRYRRDTGSFFSPYPYDGHETPGVSDPVEGGVLGLRNLERSLALVGRHDFRNNERRIAELVSPKELHDAALMQWFYINRQVVSLIGGRLLSPRLNSAGQPKGFNHPGVSAVDPQMQRKAVRFLCESVFGPNPEYLVSGPLFEAAQVDPSQVEARIRKMKEDISRLADPHRVDSLLQGGDGTDRDEANVRLQNMLAELKECMAP